MPGAGGGRLIFRSPRIAADAALLVLLVPIAWAALTFLLLIPLTLLSVILKAEDVSPFIWMAGIGAVAVLGVAAHLRLFWTLTLDAGAVVVGKWWPRRVPYSRVVYLSAGAATDPMAAIGKTRPDVVPLVFGTGMFAQRRIFLRRNDADRCLRAMHSRCDSAGAIDTRGNVLPARNPDAPPAAKYRLAETLCIRGCSAIAVAGLAVGLLFLPQHYTSGGAWGWQLAVLPAVPALLAYGAYCLRRMRAALAPECGVK